MSEFILPMSSFLIVKLFLVYSYIDLDKKDSKTKKVIFSKCYPYLSMSISFNAKNLIFNLMMLKFFHVLSTVWEPQSDQIVSPSSMSTENSICLPDEFYFSWDQELPSCRKFQGCWRKMKHNFAPVSEYCDNNSIKVGLYICWLSQYNSSNAILQVLVQIIDSQTFNNG